MTADISEIAKIYPFKSNFLKIKEHNYHYIDEGCGRPIVMLHGNPTWSFYYRNLISEFSKNYRVVVPDHMGCGLSDKPQDYDYRLEAHIDNLETLILDLDLKDIVLMVHDWGGAIGMGFAVRHPERIKGFVILNSSAFSIDFMPWRIALCRIPWLGEKLLCGANIFCRAATSMAVVKPLDALVKKGYMLPYDSYENRIAVMRFVEDIPTGPAHRSYEVLLEIEHGLWQFREFNENPVCLIWGLKDWCFDKRFLERWKLYYPQAQSLELEDAGHYVLEDAHEQIIPFLHNFFNENNLL